MPETETTTRRPAFTPRLALGLFAAWLAITAGWWALAFARAAPASPDWLARTQYVCFGTLSNGLPDTYGWVSLTTLPLAMLVTLFVLYGRDLRAGFRGLWGRWPGRALLAGVAVLVAAEAGWVGTRIEAGLRVAAAQGVLPARAELPADFPRSDRAAPDFRLVDQHGDRLALSDLRGHVVYLTFAFGHCEASCPVVVKSTMEAARATPELDPRVLIVTLDPWRDTAGSLAGLAEQWKLGRVGHVLSGSLPAVNGVLDRYEVTRERDRFTGDIVHATVVYVIDPRGDIAFTLNSPSPRRLAEAARRAAGADGSDATGGTAGTAGAVDALAAAQP